MKTIGTKKRIFVLMLAIVLVMGTMSMVFADVAKPVVDFTSSGVTFNKEAKLLRFNLKWSHPDDDSITVKYSIDSGKTKTLGTYSNQNDQVIAHIYLEGNDVNGSILNLYAVDSEGNESEKISSEFQIASSPGITIKDGEVPLSVSEGTWSLINLFLAALSVAMVAVSFMIFIENRSMEGFKSAGKMRSSIIALVTFLMAVGNIAILLTTQSLKHEMVMVDNMTIAMLIIAVLSVISTMILAVRAFGVQSEKEMAKN